MNPAAALDGIEVLDLCDASGTYCAKLLADMGAKVTLVEPLAGSPMRAVGPFHPRTVEAQRAEASPFFWHFNANKRSVALDLEAVDGRRSFLQLAAHADVVVESSPPGSLAARGLGYETLRAAKPELVLTSITPFGQSGPYRDFRAGDLVAQALGGLVHVNGHDDDEPLQGFGLPAYHSAAVWAAIGSLLALLDRRRTGRGQWVDVSIHACATAALEHATSLYRATGKIARRSGSLHWTRAFRTGACRDGHIVHSVTGDWTALAEWVAADSRDGVLTAGEWSDPDYRYENHEHLFATLDRWAADKPALALAEEAQLRRLPYSALQPPEALLSNPQLRARSYFFPVRHDRPAVSLQYPGAPFVLGDSPRRPPRRPPQLGEHNSDLELRERRRASTESPDLGAPAARSLQGLRVLDFTWAVAGPLATRILADQGADVIKVERPGVVRDIRVPGLASNLNRGKRSIAIDMSHARGVTLVRRLLPVCDVVVDNFSPRVMRNWGLSGDEMRRLHPALISLSMSAFGATGPHADRVGYGPTLQAAAGHSWSMRQRDLPAGWGFSYSDTVAGQMAAAAVLMAVWHRQQTGAGQRIDLSQFETLIAVSGPALLSIQAGLPPSHGNGSQEAAAAPHGVYRCADDPAGGSDRWCAIAVFGDDDWRRFVAALGSPAWALNRRFDSHAGRQRHRADLDLHVAQWTRPRPAESVMHLLQQAGIGAGVVADARDLCERDPQLRHRRYWVPVDVGDGRSLELDGAPLLRDGKAVERLAPAPGVGEHSDAILIDLLRLDHDEVLELRRDHVVA